VCMSACQIAGCVYSWTLLNVCMYVCVCTCVCTHICMYVCIPEISQLDTMYVHTFVRYNLTYVKKQTMTLVSAFRRDARPPKPPECLDDDGVGFQETLAEDVCFSHCGATKRRCLLAPYTNLQRLVLLHSVIKHLKLCSVRCICTHPLVPLPHHTQTTICSSCKHNDSCGQLTECKWWEGPHK